MRLGSRRVGAGCETLIVAEIGSNHDGDLDKAQLLVEAAAAAGADVAKFQLYRADTLYPGRITEGAIPDAWLPVLQQTCRDVGVEFLCSVFCLETLRAYQQVYPAGVKIASPEAVNEELLEAASAMPMLVSTGALDWAGTDRVHAVLEGLHAEFALLHCVSAYPARLRQLNLDVVRAMEERYNVPVGFSDHSLHYSRAPVIAVALGACVIEKHFTLDRTAKGPDHAFALEPGRFQMMVRDIRIAERMLGDGVKRVQPSEDATDRRAA